MTRRQILPFESWPDADRALWTALVAEGGPLDDAGPLSRLRATSRESLQVRYARWLGWLAETEPAALDQPPLDRMTPQRLAVWIDGLSARAPMSRSMILDGALRVAAAAAPERDWTLHRRLRTSLQRAARADFGSRKLGRVPDSGVLLDAGLRLAGPIADAATTELAAAISRRDGTMLALLALMPMRARSFSGLALGRSVVVEAARIRIELDADMLKTGSHWLAEVPEPVASLLRRYIEEIRPWLLARGRTATAREHDLLWAGRWGAPFTAHNMGVRLRTVTERVMGVSVSPHFFRDAAATTLARTSPEAARLTRGLLGHSGFRTATRHYNQARGIEAGRDYAAVLARLKKDAP